MKKLVVLSSLLFIFNASFADDTANLPNAGFFAGLGGTYNSMNIERDLDAAGISDVYLTNGPFQASGEAGGPATDYKSSQSTLAPGLQLGYFRHFPNSSLVWGAKFSYEYLGITDTDNAVNVPQAGNFTNNGQATNFTGHVVVGSIQATLNHQLALMPFIGQSFKNSYVYFGAGPELFDIQTKINNTTGYADLNGVHTNITGSSANFSDDNWEVGGGAQVGVNYYFDPTWSLDLNYSYAMVNYTIHDNGGFSNTSISGGTSYTTVGTLYFKNDQTVAVQSVMLSINKLFA